MKIFKIVIAVLLSVSAVAVVAKAKKVKVKTPGTLERLIKTEERSVITDLQVGGTLNNADIRFLRELCGSDSSFNAVPSVLRRLDISDVDFTTEGADSCFARGRSSAYGITSVHTMPQFMFYGADFEDIVLPSRLDTISVGAISSCRNLRSLWIADGVYVDTRAITADSSLATLRLPAMTSGIVPATYGLSALRSLTYGGDVCYVPSGSFVELPYIEDITFGGLVGHIDGYTVTSCPALRRITFRGPVNTTGGPQFVKDCPVLEEVRFDGLLNAVGFTAPSGCPKLSGYSIGGAVVSASDTVAFPPTAGTDILARPEMMRQLSHLIDYQIDQLLDPSEPFLRRMAVFSADMTSELAEAAGLDTLCRDIAEALKIARNSDDMRPKLDILKDSPAYAPESEHGDMRFTYAVPSDSLLSLTRETFNLDSIAGRDTDVSRMLNLLRWVHDLVRHDGGSGNPSCPRNLRALAEVCHKEERGVNCRMMAIMLAEALLAEGIPARYLTCESKAWSTDMDCHVICVAWSYTLGKWVWLDPTFAAYVTDENGLLLHPGEVRYRLQHDLPLVLNEDANWNHTEQQTKEGYLENYMAKNLYIITANTINQPEPEGPQSYPHDRGLYVTLAPQGSDYTNTQYLTADEGWFWQSPRQ